MIIRKFYALTIVAVIGLTACNETPTEKAVSNKETILERDKFLLTDLNGIAVSLKQYEGKTIFLNVWATWCKPCIDEMPSIAKAKQLLNDTNIVFILASDEDAEVITEFKAAASLPFNYAIIQNPGSLNINSLPTTFIFNPSGVLKFSEAGSRKWDEEASLDIIRKN